jgi:TPR repeat protein
MYDLGNLLLTGDGVERNTEKGIAWLKRATEAGSTDAIYRLGLLYGGLH